MATQTTLQNPSQTAERSSSVNMILGLAVMGCFIAGAVGIAKAVGMESGLDVLLSLLGSVFAFGAVFYIYLGKR